MMTTVWGTKVMRHHTWKGFEAHLSYLLAAFNILTLFVAVMGWNRMTTDASTAPLLTSPSDTN